MAPEVFCGQVYDHKSDIYSYGILIWECLSRRLPYSWSKDSVAYLMEKITKLHYRPLRIKNIIPQLEQLLGECMRSNGTERPKPSTILKVLNELDVNEHTRLTPLDKEMPSRKTDDEFLNVIMDGEFGDMNNFKQDLLNLMVIWFKFPIRKKELRCKKLHRSVVVRNALSDFITFYIIVRDRAQ